MQKSARRHLGVCLAAVLIPVLLLSLNQLTSLIPRGPGLVLSYLIDAASLVLWPASLGGIGVAKGHLLEAWGLFAILIVANVPWFYLLWGLWAVNQRLRRSRKSRPA